MNIDLNNRKSCHRFNRLFDILLYSNRHIRNPYTIFYNDIKADSFLYSFDLSNSTITKFNNPILNNGLVHNSIQEQHSFISLSKSINDIVIKDEVIYFSITIISLSNENRHSSIEINNVTSLDSLAANLNFWDSEILLGLCVFTLTEIGRNCFLIYSEEEKRGFGVERLSITHKKLSRKNSIIISCMDSNNSILCI